MVARSGSAEEATDSARQFIGSAVNLQLLWPVYNFEFSTSEIRSNMTGFGQFGRPYSTTVPGSVRVHSFESPAETEKEYLYGGGIWVGGIVGQDTLVSLAVDGWQADQEMYPNGFPLPGFTGNLSLLLSPAHIGIAALFDDTIHAQMVYPADFLDGTPYKPLHLTFSNRGYVWDDPDAQYCLIYDMVISNIGRDTIRAGYFGLYLDADVGFTNTAGYLDDVAGGIESERMGYVVDNDGDLTDSVSFERCFAAKILYTSFGGKCNFNWYVGGGGGPLDYGPMLRSNARDYGTGGSGYPQGDRNKYHLLSAPEWDFDQVMTRQLAGHGDWLPAYDSTGLGNLTNGGDTRFVLSVGPFDLLPDSSVRIQYALLTAENIHTDLHILDFLDFAPELYTQSLHLDHLVAKGRVADSLAALLRDPMYPPSNLRAPTVSADSIVLSWDPWVIGGIDSYELFGGPIPKEAYTHEGVPPPWYTATELPTLTSLPTDKFNFESLPSAGGYAFAVSHKVAGKQTFRSEPIFVTVPPQLSVPNMQDTIAYVREGDALEVRWSPSENGQVRQYNLYRFQDSTSANHKYLRHYSTIANGSEIDTVSESGREYYYYSLSPFASIAGNQTSFLDKTPENGFIYVVTAVDSAGFETEFSNALQVWEVSEPSKDILVLTHGIRVGTYTIEDSIDQFYHRVLQGYDYDLYSVVDSFSACRPTKPACLDWRLFTRYRLVIVDDNLRDNVLRNWYEDEEAGFARYLGYKGVLVYCGLFANLGWPEISSYSLPQWYEKQSRLVHDFFGVDSVFTMGALFYKVHTSPPYIDSLMGFTWAEPAATAPPVYFDSQCHAFATSLTANWPETTPALVAAFRPDSQTTVIHRFRSSMPSVSKVESEPVGLMKLVDSSLTFTFGFHFWYLESQGAHDLIDWIFQTARIVNDPPDPEPQILPVLRLAQNYPNPFNAATVISFSLPESGHVSVDVFNILGQRVKRLVDEDRSAGKYQTEWNGTDYSGRSVASGVYLYRLEVDGRSQARKMILLR